MNKSAKKRVRLALVAAMVAMSSTACVVPAWSRLFTGLGTQTCNIYVLEPVPAGWTESPVVPGVISLGCTYDQP